MGLVNTLGSFVCQTSYSDLPRDVVGGTKDRLLDFLAGAFSECKSATYKPIYDVLRSFGGSREATVIGKKAKLPAGFAAIMNSGVAFDIGDGSRFAGLHPGTIVIPAALAVSEAEAKTRAINGRDLILAIALGYEVMVRVGRVMNPAAVKRGFHLTGIVGPLGSATAAGKIMDLDEVSMANALSMATLCGSGLLQAFEAPRPLVQVQTTRACEAGIVCALLGRQGVKGNETILEEAFIPAYSDVRDVDSIGQYLGKDYMITKTYIKMHCGCRHIHAPIDAALDIVKRHSLKIEDIEQIKAQVYQVAMDLEIEDPKNGDEAQFNLPFGVAVALIYGDAFPDKFSDKNLENEKVRALMQKVQVVHNPDLDKDYPRKRGTIVEVVTRDGKSFSNKLDFAKGEPEWPLSKSEIEYKFNYLASKAIDAKTRQAIISYVDKLEKAEELSGLFTLLGGG